MRMLRLTNRRVIWILLAVSLHVAVGTASAQNQPLYCLGASGFVHQEAIKDIATGRDQEAFTLSQKGLFIWDLKSGQSRPCAPDIGARNILDVSPDGSKVLTV